MSQSSSSNAGKYCSSVLLHVPPLFLQAMPVMASCSVDEHAQQA
jgi:hypothetical protein